MASGEPPTKMEITLLEEFRRRIGASLKSGEEKRDPYLLRWIRARDHNLEKAEDMLRSAFLYRDKMKADNILSTPVEHWFSSTFPYWVDGIDKLGYPVLELPLGARDFRRVMVPERECYVETYICRFFEDILSKIRASNKNEGENGTWPNTLFTAIVDWKGYSYAQLINWKAAQGILKMAATYEAYYPEIIHKIFFINCPRIFPLFMALLKPVIAVKTLGKITCYGGKEEWLPAVQSQIDVDQLGHLYGGMRELTVEGNVFQNM